MSNGNAFVMYLLLRERERELAREGETGRLLRDARSASERRQPDPTARPTSPWPFGLGRLTRRAALAEGA